MISISLRGNGLAGNKIFDLDSSENRDNCFAPYFLLREKFHAAGYSFNTSDMVDAVSVEIELHQDVQFECAGSKNYLLMFETEFIKPENLDPKKLQRYRKVFTWNDSLVDGGKYIKLNFPNPIVVHPADGFLLRDRFCCLISSNRALSVSNSRDLYVERVSAIRWFESHASHDFDLYGVGWSIPAVKDGFWGKIARRYWGFIARFIPILPFSSYRGRVAHKRDVLTRTRFSICYENVCDLPGYITEKIFDCFFSGCVPVYWGASNVTDYIPADCFVDRRQFSDMPALYRFLKAMTEDEFIGYQRRIASFLQSDAAYPFSADFFAETIVNTIVQDLDDQA